MSGFLEKIFLGNVNEQGELDQDGYTQEDKAGLTLATSKNKDTIVGNAVTDDDTRAAEDDGTIAKSEKAIDFSREEEAAEDLEVNTANDVYVEKAKRMLQKQPHQVAPTARKTDDNYDDYDEPPVVATDEPANNVQPAPAPAPIMEMAGEASAPTAPVAKKVVEAPVDVRRNGLLLFSDMIIAPPTTTARMPSRRKHTSSNVKPEPMSDEEEKFVDEAARRAAAAAALRLREQREAGGIDEDAKEAEEEEEEQEEDTGEGSISRQTSCFDSLQGSISRQTSFSTGADDAAVNASGDAASVVEGEGGKGPGQSVGGAGQGGVGRVVALPTWEARSWEEDIVWGDSSASEEEEDGDGEEKDATGADNDDEFDQDEFELDEPGEAGDVIMRDHFGGGGAGGAAGGGGSGGGSGCRGHKRRDGGGGGSRDEDEDDEEKRRKTIQERIADAKRYFLEREHMPYRNAVRIGEYNEALEQGEWVSQIIWNDQHLRNSRVSVAARRASGGRRVTLGRPTKGKDCGSILGQSIVAPQSKPDLVHECIPPWWSRRGPDLQARQVPLLDELAQRLDLSHDDYYQEGGGTKARIKLGRPSVLHAPVTKHLRQRPVRSNQEHAYRTDFHRNRIFRDPKASYTISFTPQEIVGEGGAGGGKERKEKEGKGPEEKILSMKHLRDVTVKDSANLLVEHLEEVPPLVSNAGMASRIKHYYRSKNDQPPPSIPDDALADGKGMGLDVQQESPFFGELPDGAQAYVSALENNMLRHPIAKHTPADTDFLVVCKADKYYLRPINSLYCAGQCHPFRAVPAPNSKEREKYQKRHLITFIYGCLSKNGTLRLPDVFDEFPTTSETLIRKQLKDCAQFNREGGDGGYWTLKDGWKAPDDVMDEADTPDMVCMHESLQAGQMRLKNMGVKTLQRGDDVTAAVTEISKDMRVDPLIRHGALCVQELLWRAPWNQSANLVQASDHRLQLKLSTVVGSRKAVEEARRDELMSAQRTDVKELKKAAAEYSRRRQGVFQEMLDTISQQERDLSSEDESGEDAYDEDSGALASNAFGPDGRRRGYRKETIAHRWRKEASNTGDIYWTCTTIKNPEQVAKIVSDKNKRKPADLEESLDERSKADARREKKKLKERERRKKQKAQREYGGAGGSSMFLDDDDEDEQTSSRIVRQEKAGVIKITKDAMQDIKKQKKRMARELPEHLQAKGGRAIKRRRLDPKRDLNSILERALQAMWQDEKALNFRSAVDSRNNPLYRTIVKNPIDLNIIKTRLQECMYTSKKQFMADVALMVSNCKLYNEARDRRLVSDVKELESICNSKLEENRSTLAEAEAMIRLADRLLEITRQLITSEFENFKVALNSKQYTSVIKRPMGLSSIIERATSFSYCSRHGFMEDMKLIRDNCHQYCTNRHPNLPPVADKLIERVEKLLQENSETLRSLEEKVGTWAHHSKVGTPGTSYPGTPAIGRSVPGSPGAVGAYAARSPALAEENEVEDNHGDGGALEDELENELENAMEEDDDNFAADDELTEGMPAPADADF